MTVELPSSGSTLKVTLHLNPTSKTYCSPLLHTVVLHICLNFDSSHSATCIVFISFCVCLNRVFKGASVTAVVLPTAKLLLTSWPLETCLGNFLSLLHQKREIIWTRSQHPPESICSVYTTALQKQILNYCCKSPKFFSKCKHSCFF